MRCEARESRYRSAHFRRLGLTLLSVALLSAAAGCATSTRTTTTMTADVRPVTGAAPVPAGATTAGTAPAVGGSTAATGLAPAGASGGDPATRRPGGFYLDDGPGSGDAAALERLARLPDLVPVDEPLHPRANRPYRALGNAYQPMTRRVAFRQRGVASWYGKRYHGNPTSTGERYDMYQMTAAHPTLPLPSFARVTNLRNGRSVVVRVNDRGPFLHDRAIDLSYLAAYRLDFVKDGSAAVEIELLEPARRPANPVAPMPPSSPASASASGVPTTHKAVASTYFLQLGAYKARDNAEAAVARLAVDRQTILAPVALVPDNGIYRVRAGPYATRDEALKVGSALTARRGVRSVVVSR